MLQSIIPKLPMRDKAATRSFYESLGFQALGADYEAYLMVQRDHCEVHFFEHKTLDPRENYGQIYLRTDDIEALYQSLLDRHLAIHPEGKLGVRPWGQKEFSMLDPDNNLLTFGQAW